MCKNLQKHANNLGNEYNKCVYYWLATSKLLSKLHWQQNEYFRQWWWKERGLFFSKMPKLLFLPQRDWLLLLFGAAMLLFFHNKVFANSPWMVIFMQLFDKCKFFFSSSSRLPNCHLPKVSSCRYRKSFFPSLSLLFYFYYSTLLFFLQTLRM